MPTPLPPEQKAFQAAVRANLRAQGALLRDTSGALATRLRAAAGAIAALLGQQPAEWQQWQLAQIQDQVNALLQGMGGDVSDQVDQALQDAWKTGIQSVDAPLAAASIHVDYMLPMVDTALLTSLRDFTAGRIRDLTAEALGNIDRAIGLTALGAQTPFQAIQAVQAQLGTKDAASLARASTIVRTSLGQAYGVAGQLRKVQAQKLVPDLQKQWRRSGKIHSRWSHDAVDGMVVDADKPFRIPTKGAGAFVEMMHPHDPQAPASEVINCGCTSRPWLNRWGLPAGGTPFSDQEVALNPMKAAGKGWLTGGEAGG